MAKSFGLVAYRAIAGRTDSPRYIPSTQRPKGELVWISAPEPDSFDAISDLADRLVAARDGLTVLITLPEQEAVDADQGTLRTMSDVILDTTPSEHPDAVRAFWRHWQPDMCLWAWGRLRPNLIMKAHKERCPLVLIDGDITGFDGRRERWLPDLSRQLLEPCAALMVRSAAALQKLESMGLSSGRIDLTPPLEAGGRVLECNETELSDLTALLRGRPVWLANSVHPEELPAILAAHRHAMRLSHRLLLIIVPAQQGFDKQVGQVVDADGFRAAHWSDGEEPDDAIQVLLATDTEDLGLFYRIAPVTLMGGTLGAGHIGRNPFEAAALGSAVLYGPNARRFVPFYNKLAKAGAAKMIENKNMLGAAVTRLIAPDQAAAMAHAGWDVISQGAAVIDRVTDLVQSGLDGDLESINARP